MRRPIDFGVVGAFAFFGLVCGICGYAIGWDQACVPTSPVRTSGIDHERSTASAICVQESAWRDGLTVACARELDR